MALGKQRRLHRILGSDRKTLLIALDHSFTIGQAAGLSNMRLMAEAVVSGRADGLIAHRGTAEHAVPMQNTAALILHLSGNTALVKEPDSKAQVCEVETAIMLGADAVSAQLTLGVDSGQDKRALTHIARIARACDQFGIPLLVMSYCRSVVEHRARSILHAARVASELGADIVKVAHPGEAHLSELVDSIFVPVVIAGGDRECWSDFLEKVRIFMQAGLGGLCVGRQILFHSDPVQATTALRDIIHGQLPHDPNV